jgi:hypothetical protein
LIRDTHTVPPDLLAADDEYIINRDLSPDENLWAAVVHRARLDAINPCVGNKSQSENNHWSRDARRWFRKRDQADEWGWIIDVLGISPVVEDRIAGEIAAAKSQ